jgi:hypothetical protein
MSATKMGSIKTALSFTFEDKRWVSKYLVAGLLLIASAVIPFIPLFFLLGYAARIMKRITNDDGQASLPEWKDWGDLLIDGLRLFGVSLVYMLPGIVLMIIGYLAFLVPAVNGTFDRATTAAAPLGALAVMWFIMGIGILLSLAASFVLGPALARTAAQERFGAGFEFTAIWKVLRVNFWGFVVAFALLVGLSQLVSGLVVVSWLTICLICLTPFIGLAVYVYLTVVAAALYGVAYREGMDKLTPPVADQ